MWGNLLFFRITLVLTSQMEPRHHVLNVEVLVEDTAYISCGIDATESLLKLDLHFPLVLVHLVKSLLSH